MNNSGLLVSDRPSPADFVSYLPWACMQLDIEEPVIINKIVQYDTTASSENKAVRKKSKSARNSRALSEVESIQDNQDSIITVKPIKTPENAVKIWAFYNKNDQLVQLLFDKTSRIPQRVLKILTLVLPFHSNLQSITIKGRIDKLTIPELSNIMLSKNITDVSFDGVFLREANFYLLLDHDTLRNLSLARCRINDDVTKILALKLMDPLPASKCLGFLNLSSNFITDDGAKYLGQALRSNRQLYYLNLSGNSLSDTGAAYIFNSLLEFPMKIDESIAMKTRYIDYLRKRSEYIETTLRELNDVKVEEVKPLSKVKDKKAKVQKCDDVQTQNNEEKALAMADEELGVFDDPFMPDTIVKDGLLWCRGNNVLCYLNLAYNDLTYFTIKKLLTVLNHQRELDRKPKGLIKVVLQGNRIPYKCQEISDLDELFEMNVLIANKRQSSSYFSKRRLTTSK